jgi:glycosyltransferase involved in cell wall biosynthesis
MARRAEDVVEPASDLLVSGVRNPHSAGVARYTARLAEALGGVGIEYRLEERATGAAHVHFHLANSSRALLAPGRTRVPAFVVTVHDVVPRTRSLLPLYKALAYPKVARSAAVIVHSAFAADMLLSVLGRRPERLEVIPHPAHRPSVADRLVARRTLGWPGDALIAVIPGAIRPVKLVREAIAAVSRSPGWRLALAGGIVDRRSAEAARAEGALLLADPGDTEYESAIVASDCVLCLRADSVGETNGPLLDALGAGRAVLATAAGSIPEVAGDCALYCEGTTEAIRDGLAALSDPAVRMDLEGCAALKSTRLTWHASAVLHASLLREVFG